VGQELMSDAQPVVLAVDDVPENLHVLGAVLGEMKLQLVTASSGTEALEHLLRYDVAVALIDVQMPGMTGFELAELMRGTDRTRHVPIIFVTAAAPERGHIFRGYEAGAVDFLFKPIEPHLLRSKIGVFIELFRQRQLLRKQLEEHRMLVRTAEMMTGVLGHDLRNPLAAIVSSAEVLRLLTPNDEQLQKVARTILTSSQRMRRLIDQLLDFATARLGALPVRKAETNLSELAEHAVAELRARQAALKLTVTGDVVGYWDPDRVLQVLSNLLGNAVNHGMAGHEVQIRIDGTDASAVAVEIENVGEIPASVHGQLFSPFVTGERTGGAGLGLSIVQQIVQAHSGTIEAMSTNGRTVMRFTLPRGEPDAGSAPEPSMASQTLRGGTKG
jgi:two-component system sensor histidine kinase/response regulator